MCERMLLVKLVLLFSSVTLLISCATVHLTSSGSTVTVARSAPRYCIYRGYITNTSRDVTGDGVRQTQINALRDRAAQLGANVIVITGHQADYYPEYFPSKGVFLSEAYEYTMSAVAYYCRFR